MSGSKMVYDAKIAKSVCDALACTECSIGQVLKAVKGAPKLTRWYEWLHESEDCAEMYARAREAQGDYMAAQIVEIADSERDPNRARVRVDARKWVAAKLRPRVYGDKVALEQSGPGGGAIPLALGKMTESDTEALVRKVLDEV